MDIFKVSTTDWIPNNYLEFNMHKNDPLIYQFAKFATCINKAMAEGKDICVFFNGKRTFIKFSVIGTKVVVNNILDWKIDVTYGFTLHSDDQNGSIDFAPQGKTWPCRAVLLNMLKTTATSRHFKDCDNIQFSFESPYIIVQDTERWIRLRFNENDNSYFDYTNKENKRYVAYKEMEEMSISKFLNL